jgi:hypothetical protein
MLWFPGEIAGTALFAAAKLWLLLLPLLWLRFVDRAPLSLSPARQGGLAAGLAGGVALSVLVAAAYILAGERLLDNGTLSAGMTAVGLDRPAVYLAGAAYWILVNSLLEEYVWRWFCFQQCRRLMSAPAAVAVAALCFTLHHVVALAAFMPAGAVALCAVGIFTGGAVWSALYARYGSIWPAYLSHAVVDLCVFGIGARLLFGAG